MPRPSGEGKVELLPASKLKGENSGGGDSIRPLSKESDLKKKRTCKNLSFRTRKVQKG